MTGDHSSDTEVVMVKGLIDNITGDKSVMVSVASDTENKAKKTCRLLPDQENCFGCVAHVLLLSFIYFLSEFTQFDVELWPGLLSIRFAELREIFVSHRHGPNDFYLHNVTQEFHLY